MTPLPLFTESYSIKLLAMLCRRPGFLRSHRDIIKPAYFDDAPKQDIARLALEYYDKHGKSPTVEFIEQAVVGMLRADRKRMSAAEYYVSLIVQIASDSLTEESDVTERVVRFAKQQAMKSAILGAVDSLERGEIEGIHSKIEEAERVGANKTDLGVSYWEDLDRFEYKRTGETIATGWAPLDEKLGGGVAHGEGCLIEAPPGRFKTTSLINMACGALRAGSDVVFFPLEMRERRIVRRFDRYFLGNDPSEMVRDEVTTCLSDLQKHIRRTLRVKAYTIGEATVSMMESDIEMLIEAGVLSPSTRPLTVVVDYGQILKAQQRHDSDREKHRANYQALLRLANRWPQTRVLTAMQSNRQSVSRKIIGTEYLSECFMVAADYDLILSINQTAEEEQAGALRIHVAKARDASSFNTFDCVVDPALHRIQMQGERQWQRTVARPVTSPPAAQSALSRVRRRAGGSSESPVK